MLEDLNTNITSQANITPKRNNEVNRDKVAFKGAPNAVDNTPTADTFQNQQLPPDSPLRTAAFVLPTWYGLNKGTDLFNKACGGEYDKSLMGRLAKFGDRVSGSRILNNSVTRKIGSTWNNFKVKAQAYIDRHPMLSAMQKTPTAPENSMPKSFMESQNECDLKEAAAELEKFISSPTKSLKEAGATKAEIQQLKAKYGTNIFGRIKNKQGAIKELQLKKLGGDALAQKILAKEARIPQIIQAYEQRIAAMLPTDPALPAALDRLDRIREIARDYRGYKLKGLKLNKLGLGKGVLESVKAEPLKHAATVEAALEKGAVAAPKLSRHLNKLKVMSAPLTKLGKFFPKMAKLGMRGLTFGGGLINTAFVAFPLATSIKNAFDAPKDKKSGTLAEGVVDALSWVVSMPLALLGMHSINGLKNTGLSKAQYGAFKNELSQFNKKVAEGGFASLAEWTAEKARVEGLKAVTGPQSKFTKAMKKVGEFLSIGLEQFKPYKESTNGLTGAAKRAVKMGNLKRSMPNFLKNLVGYPLRFALYMVVFAPIVEKLMSFCTKAIFGEAYDPDKVREEQAKEAERLAQLYSGPRFLPNPEAVKGLDAVDVSALSNKNLIKQKLMGVTSDMPDTPQNNPVYGGFNAAPAVMEKGVPFMPPTMPQGQQAPATQQGTPSGADPQNTVPRSFVPAFDMNAPLPYDDPMADPNNPRGYAALQDLIKRSREAIDFDPNDKK